jgi:hypothetical protein
MPARDGFVGWLADPGPPFSGRVFMPYGKRSLVLIGANGYGKTRLLNAIVEAGTGRVFQRVPPRLAPYLTAACLRVEEGEAIAGPSDLAELFQLGEAARAVDGAHERLADHLGLPELRWIVRWMGSHAPATLSAVSADDLLAEPAAVIRAAPRHVAGAIERWTLLGEQGPEALDLATENAFRTWADVVLTACGSPYRVSANPLIAVDEAYASVSLLSPALAFAEALARRVGSRLMLLVGLSAELRCLPAHRFAWQLKTDEGWIPLEWASRAIRRWSALSAQDTLDEMGRYAAEAEVDDSAVGLAAVLRGDLGGSLLPAADPGPFATHSSWLALDEPEVHLFASESRRLGDVLAGHGRAGRTLFVTHSLDLAARLVGSADFVMFDGPGRFTVDRPGDGLEKLLRRLAVSGPGILAETRVLYVEGDWDVELIGLLHGNLLAQHNVLLSRMNGVRGASLAASSVWQRMMLTSFGVMFDALDADDVARTWATLRDTVAKGGRGQALRSLRQRVKMAEQRHARYEDVEILRLFAAVLDGGLEERLHLVMHGLSDIFQVMHPSVFGLTAKSWRAAGYDGKSSFKHFVQTQTRIDLKNGNSARRRVRAFTDAGQPVDEESAERLHRALLDFAAGQTTGSVQPAGAGLPVTMNRRSAPSRPG